LEHALLESGNSMTIAVVQADVRLTALQALDQRYDRFVRILAMRASIALLAAYMA
jgi:hypothetical protein